MAMEARKPIFSLKSADGAIGAHIEAVRSCYTDFQKLAGKIASYAGMAFN
jgi:chromosome partitioning protein